MGAPYAEVIGDPIAHSKSPLIHKFWLEKLGLDYDYVRTRVTAETLPAFLHSRLADPDWCGCNVTIPHKIAAASLVAELRRPATRIGAVNCVVREGRAAPRLVGHNSDASGFLEPLTPWLAVERDSRIAHVVGTGGAALAITAALDGSGFTVFNYGRARGKAEALRERLGIGDEYGVKTIADLIAAPWQAPVADRQSLTLLVNATPLGMSGYPPLPIHLGRFPPDAVVYDLVYAPLETPLLQAARARGLQTIDGLGMLIGQAAAAFALFFAQEAPRELDCELRALLAR